MNKRILLGFNFVALATQTKIFFRLEVPFKSPSWENKCLLEATYALMVAMIDMASGRGSCFKIFV